MAQRKESHGEIDWSAAEVQGTVLTVPLTGEPSKAWTERVAEVVERLKRGRRLGRDRGRAQGIEVSGVQAGAEIDVRHFLEGAVCRPTRTSRPAEEAGATATSGRGPTAR